MKDAVTLDAQSSLDEIWHALCAARSAPYGTVTTVQTLDYYPYGASRIASATSTNELRKYIGQFYDDGSNLSYLNARYYDGGRGQFLSEHPVALADPKKQDLQNPQSLNTYSYADDNPITRTDPSGSNLTLGARA